MKKKDNEEIVTLSPIPCIRNYRSFPLVAVDIEPNTDLVEIQQGDVVILQKRSFHHLDGINASSYSLRSQIADGLPLSEAANSLPSKRAIVDQSTDYMNNFKPILNNE